MYFVCMYVCVIRLRHREESYGFQTLSNIAEANICYRIKAAFAIFPFHSIAHFSRRSFFLCCGSKSPERPQILMSEPRGSFDGHTNANNVSTRKSEK